MTTFGKLWAGRVYGSNTGNFFLELDEVGDTITGTLRLMDNFFGLAVYRVKGSFDSAEIRLIGEGVQAQPGVELGKVDVVAILTPEGNLRGKWSSSLGAGGTFEGYPHDIPPSSQMPGATTNLPEQLFMYSVQLGAVRMYAHEIWDLVQLIRRDFVAGRPIVTYSIRGSEVSQYIDAFRNEAPSLGKLKSLKVTIQEPDAHGINKSVLVELNAWGQNEVKVQGVNESWVIGKAEAVSRLLRNSERVLLTTYKKFGLTLNQLIFLIMLVLIPAIETLWQRAAFVLVVVVLLMILLWIHSTFIPNALLYFGEQKPTIFQRAWPTILSWLVGATAALAAAYVFYWLTGNGAR